MLDPRRNDTRPRLAYSILPIAFHKTVQCFFETSFRNLSSPRLLRNFQYPISKIKLCSIAYAKFLLHLFFLKGMKKLNRRVTEDRIFDLSRFIPSFDPRLNQFDGNPRKRLVVSKARGADLSKYPRPQGRLSAAS